MNYKGYEAVVEYDHEDKLFVGRVINTRDVIAFDGLSVDELEASFFAAVDEYLDDCDRLGKDPDKPFSGRFNLRIPPDLHRQVAIDAEKHNVSLNTFVEGVLIQSVSTRPSRSQASAITANQAKIISGQTSHGDNQGQAQSSQSKLAKDPKARTTTKTLRK
jgi:predicted HicB family RNase H-like nuclease